MTYKKNGEKFSVVVAQHTKPKITELDTIFISLIFTSCTLALYRFYYTHSFVLNNVPTLSILMAIFTFARSTPLCFSVHLRTEHFNLHLCETLTFTQSFTLVSANNTQTKKKKKSGQLKMPRAINHLRKIRRIRIFRAQASAFCECRQTVRATASQ